MPLQRRPRTTPREAPTAKHGNTAAPANNGHDTEPWPVLDAAAYHGLAGEVVCTMAPQTEADPVALLLQLLVYSGNAISRGPYCLVGKDRHFTNLFGMLVGDTGQGAQGPLGRAHPRLHGECRSRVGRAPHQKRHEFG